MPLPFVPGELQVPGEQGQREIFPKRVFRMRAVLAVAYQ